MKGLKRAAGSVLALALCLGLATGASAGDVTFSDVGEGDWFRDSVTEMAGLGYVEGYEDGTFKPEGIVSVVEFVTMTARCLGLETGEEYGHWGGRQMANAYAAGWLDEADCAWTDFNNPVDRQLASKILAVALGLELDVPDPEYADFADAGQSYAAYVAAMTYAGLLDGYEDNTVRPARELNRAEAATLIYRACTTGERITAAPDGTPFAGTVELAGYDNPNFKVWTEDGVAKVLITHAELWTDAPDPNSSDPAEAAEAKRREQVTAAMVLERVIPTDSAVTAVWELPCSSGFPGQDCWALAATENGRWYRVDLSGQYNEGVPELTELEELRGQDVNRLTWRTTTYTEGGTVHVGEDFIIAQLGSFFELVVWSSD